MVNVLALSVVDHGFKSQSSQTCFIVMVNVLTLSVVDHGFVSVQSNLFIVMVNVLP